MAKENNEAEAQLDAIKIELNALRNVGKIIASMQDLDKVLIEILRILHNLLGFEYGTISLVDEKSRTIGTKHGIWGDEIDVFPKWIKMAQYSLDEKEKIDIQIDIVRTGETEIIDSWDKRFNKEIWDEFKHERLIRVFMPIKVMNKVIGTIEAGYDKKRKGRITEEEKRTLSAFVNQAAIAIEVATQIEAIKSEEQQVINAQKLAMINNIAGFFAHKLHNAAGTIPALARDAKEILLQAGENQNFRVIRKLDMIESHASLLMEMASQLRLPSSEKSGVQTCNVNSTIESAIQKANLDPGLINLSLNLAPNLPIARADTEQVREILLNVIKNAKESMQDGGTLGILTEYFKSDDNVSIIISDTGPGIPESIRDKLFEQPFTTTKRGMGLGLYLAKLYLLDIMGDIQLQDPQYKGATFIIKIPILVSQEVQND